MMNKLKRNRYKHTIKIGSSGGIDVLFDNAMKEIYTIDDDEYDYITEHMSDSELNLVLEENKNYSEKRKVCKSINKHLYEYYNDRLENLNKEQYDSFLEYAYGDCTNTPLIGKVTDNHKTVYFKDTVLKYYEFVKSGK